jgi:hypothetical protein
MRIINLYDLPYEVMLILEHASGVIYENQVGGLLCWQANIEGVLAPVDLDPDAVEQIMNLPYEPRRGITAEVADAVDAVLAASPGGRYMHVDRARLAESYEAWVFVVADIPESSEHQLQGPYFGAPRGFGRTTGVLTWPNSD